MPTPTYNRVERFWSKVAKGKKNECWDWQGCVYCGARGFGYGKVLWESKPRPWWRRAHRVVWELKHGIITDPKLCVLHKCDNPKCCNINHLFIGTRRDNNLDKKRKGREYDRNGSRNPNVKLSEKDVINIRKLLSRGLSQVDIAERFGVAQPQISRIKLGMTWQSLR